MVISVSRYRVERYHARRGTDTAQAPWLADTARRLAGPDKYDGRARECVVERAFTIRAVVSTTRCSLSEPRP